MMDTYPIIQNSLLGRIATHVHIYTHAHDCSHVGPFVHEPILILGPNGGSLTVFCSENIQG